MPQFFSFGEIGAGVAVLLFWFTASRGNRLLLLYLKEREIMMTVSGFSSSGGNNPQQTKDGQQQSGGNYKPTTSSMMIAASLTNPNDRGEESSCLKRAASAWFNDTRLMFYSLCIISALSYSTSTLVLMMAAEDSPLRRDNVESDALTLTNVAAYLSMIVTILWTIAQGIMLEWKRAKIKNSNTRNYHRGGGNRGEGGSTKITAANLAAQASRGVLSETRGSGLGAQNQSNTQNQNQNQAAGITSNQPSSSVIMRTSNRLSMNKTPDLGNSSAEDENTSYRSQSGAHLDDIYYYDETSDYFQQQEGQIRTPLLINRNNQNNQSSEFLADGQQQSPSQSQSQLQSSSQQQVASSNAPGSQVTSFSQQSSTGGGGYGSADNNTTTNRNSSIMLPQQQGTLNNNTAANQNENNNNTTTTNNNNNTNTSFFNFSSSGGETDCSNMMCSLNCIAEVLFPFRLLLSVAVVCLYYVVITILTHSGTISGANFSAGLSGLLAIICGIMAIGGTIFLCDRGAISAARRFGVALAVLCICLIGRAVAVLHVIQEKTPRGDAQAIIPLIDAFAITCVIVVLPSKKFCLCCDLE